MNTDCISCVLRKFSDITDIGNDALQAPVGREQRRVGDTDAERHAIASFEIAFDIQRIRSSIRRFELRPALFERNFNVGALYRVPDNDIIFRQANGVFPAPTGDSLESLVHPLERKIRVKYEDAIAAVVQDRFQALMPLG